MGPLKKTLVSLMLSVLIFTVVGCGTITLWQPDARLYLYEPVSPKEDVIVYVRSETIGEDVANSIGAAFFGNGIRAVVIPDESYIPDLSSRTYQRSCFSIAPHVAITNAGTVDGEYFIVVDETRYEAQVLFESQETNIAVIYTPDYQFPFSFNLNLNSEYNLASNVYSIGYSNTEKLNYTPRITNGIINSSSGRDGSDLAFQISNSFQTGNGGAPVFSAGDYSSVIGIINDRDGDDNGENEVVFALKANVVPLIWSAIGGYLEAKKNLPNTAEEAALATAPLFVTHTPKSDYKKRFVTVVNIDKTTITNYGRYGSYLTYDCDVSFDLLNVDTGIIEASLSGTYGHEDTDTSLFYATIDYILGAYGESEKIGDRVLNRDERVVVAKGEEFMYKPEPDSMTSETSPELNEETDLEALRVN